MGATPPCSPASLVEQHYVALTSESPDPTFDREPDLERAFLAWGRRWEQAVHLALAEAHLQDPIKFPASGLGKK